MDILNDSPVTTRRLFREIKAGSNASGKPETRECEYEMKVDIALAYLDRTVVLFEDIHTQFYTLSDSFADLNAQLVQVHRREEAVVEELHKTVLIIQDSNEKVAHAEARAADAESRASDLETYVAKLAQQLDRMIGAISSSFAPSAFAPVASLLDDVLLAA